MRNIVYAFILWLLASATANAAVTVDAIGTSQVHSTSVATIDFNNLTVGSGSNRAIVVLINFSNLVTGVTATWDPAGANQSFGTALTSGSDSTGLDLNMIFGLVNPVSGNKTLRVSWTGLSEVFIDAVSFIGVDQTGGTTSFPNASSANPGTGSFSTLSINVSTGSGDMAAATWSNRSTNIVSVNNTQLYLDNAAGVTINGAANYGSGASLTMTFNTGSEIHLSGSATGIKAAVGGVSCGALALMGVGC